MGDVTFIARREDFVAVKEVALRSEYDFIHQIVGVEQPDPLILDVGANIGMFAMLAFKIFPHARVHSFEASSDTFRILQKNRWLNPGFNWHICHQAVWKEDGIVRFEKAGASTVRRIVTDRADCEEVQSVKLSNIIERCAGHQARIQICKIDIKGAEEVVLQASLGALRRVDSMIVEIHRDFVDAIKVIGMLQSEFEFLYEIGGRKSKKPLVLASRTSFDWPPDSPVHAFAPWT